MTSDDIPVEYIPVDLEEVDGKRRIKLLENGAHPLDVLGQVASDMDQEYRKDHNGAPLVKWGKVMEHGGQGEAPHHVITLFSMESGEPEPIRQFVIIDNATGKPVEKPRKTKTGQKTMMRRDTLEHVERILDFDRMKADMKKRGLETRAAASWQKLEEVKKELEG